MSLLVNKYQQLLEPLRCIEQDAQTLSVEAARVDAAYRDHQDAYLTLNQEDDREFEQFLESFQEYTFSENELQSKQRILANGFIDLENEILDVIEKDRTVTDREKYDLLSKAEKIYQTLIRQNPDQADLIASRRRLEEASIQVVTKLSQRDTPPVRAAKIAREPAAAAMPKQAPIYGLHNAGNNCAFNSVMQAVMQEPVLQEHVKSARALAPLGRFVDAYHATPPHSGIALRASSADVRTCLTGLPYSGIRDDGRQEDAGEALELIYRQRSGVHNRLYPDVVVQQAGKLDQIVEGTSRILIMPSEIRHGWSFEALMDLGQFAHIQQQDNTLLQYTSAPELLSVNIARFARDQDNVPVKDTSAIRVPFTYTMPKERVHGSAQNIRFELNTLIVHEGSSLRGGHYVAYRKEGRQWYLISDQYRQPVTDQEVQRASQNCYQAFYRRIDN